MRTHFERLFVDYKVRGRSGLVAAWLHDESNGNPVHPRDECPFSRPFPEGFAECPAYQAMGMVTLDIGYRPLGRVWSCRHLRPQRHAADDRWYGSCIVGDVRDRERWAAAFGQDRLQKIEGLRQEMAAVTAPYAERLWQHKSRQLALIASGTDASPETRRLQSLTDRLALKLDALLRSRRDLLEEIQLPEAACRELIKVALDQLVSQQKADFQLSVPNEVLAKFPSEMRQFFRPN